MYNRSNLNTSLGLLLVLLMGCATTRTNEFDLDIQKLANTISELESKLERKDLEITKLSVALDRERQKNRGLLNTLNMPGFTRKDLSTAISRQQDLGKDYHYYIMAIQIALRNAGFDTGIVDGRIGKRTLNALMEFQKSYGLSARGWINKTSWEMLRDYLYVE